MSLKIFHYVFISISALLGLGLSVWGLGIIEPSDNPWAKSLGIFGLILLAILIPYGFWFARKMRTLRQG